MRWIPLVFLCLLVIVAGIEAGRAAQVAAPVVAFVGARVYADPQAVPIDDAVVLVEGTRIAAVGSRAAVTVPADARVVDCKGLTITAGFYNAHVHFTDVARWADAERQPPERLSLHLREMLTRYGYTTVVDTASDLANTTALRRRIEAGEVAGPRILTAGTALYPPDGIPYYLRDALPPETIKRLWQPATGTAAAEIVGTQLAAGADIVKVFSGSWVTRGKVLPMPTAIAGEAVTTAHERGALVFAHPSNLAGLEVALDARVDVLAHAIEDTRGMTPRHYARMKEQNMAIVPTLTLFTGRFLWDILDEIRTYARQGGTIIFGTDIGYLPDFDHSREYELMASAGLDWREILATLTTSAAARLGHANRRGRVAPGLDADLVVLGTDPVLGARGFADVRRTVRAGVVIYEKPSP